MTVDWRGLWAARELFWSFVRRDLTVRYRHAVLGVGWAVASPIAQAAIFSFLLPRLVRPASIVPYPVFVFVGITAWNFTASALRGALTSLSGHAVLISRSAFRREVLPLAAVGVAAVDFMVALPLVLVFAATEGFAPRATLVLLPLLFLVHVAFTSGIALLLAVAHLLWRDVRPLFEVSIVIWMFASSVLYTVRAPTGALETIIWMNPMTQILDAYRAIIFGGPAPSALGVMATLSAAVATLWFGLALFDRTSHSFAEVA